MAWFPNSFVCDGCGERVDDDACPRCAPKVDPATCALIERLERVRLAQERAWFAAGRSRDWIVNNLRGWPKSVGPEYPDYEWTVGQDSGGYR